MSKKWENLACHVSRRKKKQYKLKGVCRHGSGRGMIGFIMSFRGKKEVICLVLLGKWGHPARDEYSSLFSFILGNKTKKYKKRKTWVVISLDGKLRKPGLRASTKKKDS